MIGDSCEGISESIGIKSYPISSVTSFSSEVLVFFLEPSQEKHDVLLSCDFFHSRSVWHHIDKVALELTNMR